MKNFERITVDPAQMGGVPCVRGLLIPVATVLRLPAGGADAAFATGRTEFLPFHSAAVQEQESRSGPVHRFSPAVSFDSVLTTNYDKLIEEHTEGQDWSVVQGGLWNNYHDYAASAYRHLNDPDYRNISFGFRCARR